MSEQQPPYDADSRIPQRMLDLVASKRKGRNSQLVSGDSIAPRPEITQGLDQGSNMIQDGQDTTILGDPTENPQPKIVYSRSFVKMPDGRLLPRAVPPKNNPIPPTNPSE